MVSGHLYAVRLGPGGKADPTTRSGPALLPAPSMMRVPRPCAFSRAGTILPAQFFVPSEQDRVCMRSWFPPFAKDAKDGAPIVLLIHASSKAQAFRLRELAAQSQNPHKSKSPSLRLRSGQALSHNARRRWGIRSCIRARGARFARGADEGVRPYIGLSMLRLFVRRPGRNFQLRTFRTGLGWCSVVCAVRGRAFFRS